MYKIELIDQSLYAINMEFNCMFFPLGNELQKEYNLYLDGSIWNYNQLILLYRWIDCWNGLHQQVVSHKISMNMHSHRNRDPQYCMVFKQNKIKEVRFSPDRVSNFENIVMSINAKAGYIDLDAPELPTLNPHFLGNSSRKNR